jgi:hypothetical protein
MTHLTTLHTPGWPLSLHARPWMATFIACAALDGHFHCMRGPPDVQAMAADDL